MKWAISFMFRPKLYFWSERYICRERRKEGEDRDRDRDRDFDPTESIQAAAAMMMISDLPRDMVEEVLSKVPVTSMRGVRFTCKKWNTLSKNRSFAKKYRGEAAAKQRRKEFQVVVVMMLEFKVYLMSINLLNPSIERIGKLVSLDDDDGVVDIAKIFHSHGLLLCVTKDRTSLVVWNPFNGQTRWIQPRHSYHRCDRYALGYEKKMIKVLRFVDDYDPSLKRRVCEFEIFNLNSTTSSSWKVVDPINPDWEVQSFYRGLSLKGNTYWFAEEKLVGKIGRLFLLCFNFKTESFGPRLPLPFRGRYGDTVTLSSVREDQLAVLFQKSAAPYTLKIWISSKVGPNAVSWIKEVFLAVDMEPLTGFQFLNCAASFFVDEIKKVVVVIDTTRGNYLNIRNMAYVIGENGYFKTVDLGDFAHRNCWPLLCSYIPSSVNIKQAAPPGNTPS